MKRLLIPLTGLIAIAVVIPPLYGGWQFEEQVTSDTLDDLTTYNNAWCVAMGSNAHAVWTKNVTQNCKEIYYSRKLLLGWSQQTMISSSQDTSDMDPAIAAFTDTLHVVWDSDAQGILYRRSGDAGVNWGDITVIDSNVNTAHPSIAVSGSNVHVVYEKLYDIFYKRNTQSGGGSWTETQLCDTDTISQYPSVAVVACTIHVVWMEPGPRGYLEIHYRCSTDNGTNWGSITTLSLDTLHSQIYPCVAASGGNVRVVWESEYSSKVYLRSSANSGYTWGNIDSFNVVDARKPSVAANGSSIHIVWQDYDNTNSCWRIYYKYMNPPFHHAPIAVSGNTSGTAQYSSVIAFSGDIHVIWCDNRSNDYEIFYRRKTDAGKNTKPKVSEHDLTNCVKSCVTTSGIKFDGHVPTTLPLNFIIYDITGRKITNFVHRPASNDFSCLWKPDNLASGVYFVYISQEGGFCINARVIWVR